MTELHPDLLRVLDAVVIHSPVRFAVRDQTYELPASTPDDLSSDASTARERELLSALETALYGLLYIRPTGNRAQPPCDDLARRERVAALSAANASRGTWSGGWVVREIDRDGKLVLRKDELTVWAAREQVHAREGAIRAGETCRVWIGKEQRNRIPGFYFAVGEAEDDGDGDDSEPHLRYYWHLKSEMAVPFVAAATALLNAAKAPFLLKVLSDPGAFVRADAALIFLRRRDHRRLANTIARIHDAISSGLRESVPLFTKFVASGLGAAEDPPGRMSFGEHRCKLAARAICRSFLRGEHDRARRAATLAAVYAEEGLDPRYPYLGPGSTDGFDHVLSANVAASQTIPNSTGIGASATTMPRGAGCRTISPREAAIRIGESLCRNAIWDVTGRYCNWMGRVSSARAETDGPPTVAATALGPRLHDGSAGIALFLSRLHAATGDDEFRRTAQAATARSELRLARSATTGKCSIPTRHGVAAAAAMFHVRAALRNRDFKEHHLSAARDAIAAVLDAIDEKLTVPRFDATIRDGLAGLGEVVLTAGIMLDVRSFQDRARALGQVLIGRYSDLDNWPTGFPGGGPNPSLLEGTAGVGYWLLRLDAPEELPCLFLLDQFDGADPGARRSAFSG